MNYTDFTFAPMLENKRNYAIVILRAMAMLMIIGCHLSSWLGINFLSMILNVGVYVFLLISGMLYSNKQIENGFTFLKKRWIKLCIPMYYLVLLLLIYYLLNFNFDTIKAIPTYLLNLQGIGFIIHGIDLIQLNGLGHLWFLSAIMMCYVILLAVKKIETSQFWNSNIRVWAAFSFLLCVDIIATYTIELQLHYFIAFLVGYTIGKHNNKLSRKKYIVATFGMICAMATRLIARKYFDGTILYNDLVVPFTHIILAIWIYGTIQFLFQKKPNITKAIATNSIMRWLEQRSMYLYMTHYAFLVGPFYISNLPLPRLMQIFTFVIVTTVSAVLLQTLSEKTICWISKRIEE